MIPPRAFMERKGREGLTRVERVLCFAYYLAQTGQRFFSMADLRALNEHCGFEAIRVNNAVGDCKAWDLMCRDGPDRWELLPRGRRFVEALPDRSAAAKQRGSRHRRLRVRSLTSSLDK